MDQASLLEQLDGDGHDILERRADVVTADRFWVPPELIDPGRCAGRG